MPLTSAERQKLYRERLKEKNLEKFLCQKRKNAIRNRENRKKIAEYAPPEQKNIRKQWRDRKKKRKEDPSSSFPETMPSAKHPQDENDFSSSTANPIETVMLSPPSASVAPPATSVSTPDPIQTILLLPPLQPPVTLAPTMNMFGPKKTGIETQKNPGDCDKRPAEDNLTTFASYVIAQVRQFHPRLQIKAKHEINRLLYQLEMENHEYTQSRMERREDSGLSYYSNCESPAPSSPRIGKQEITSSPEAE